MQPPTVTQFTPEDLSNDSDKLPISDLGLHLASYQIIPIRTPAQPRKRIKVKTHFRAKKKMSSNQKQKGDIQKYFVSMPVSTHKTVVPKVATPKSSIKSNQINSDRQFAQSLATSEKFKLMGAMKKKTPREE
jgi:hypothetical protein